MGILNAIWTFFATYILQKPPYMVGFLTLLGYCLMGKKWYLGFHLHFFCE